MREIPRVTAVWYTQEVIHPEWSKGTESSGRSIPRWQGGGGERSMFFNNVKILIEKLLEDKERLSNGFKE